MQRFRAAAPLLSAVLLSATIAAAAQVDPIPGQPTTQPGSKPAPRTLTIDEAVALAVRSSRTLRIAEEGVLRARGRVNESKAGFMPSVTASGTITRLDEGSSVTLTGPGGEPVTIPIVKQTQKSADLAVAVPIDISGLIRAAVQASQFQEIAARLEFNRALNQTVLDTRTAYLGVLRARAFVAVAEQALRNAEERKGVAEAGLRAGTGTRFDVLRSETEVANAQQGLIAARDAVELATAALNNVLGLDQNTPVTLAETPEDTGAAPGFDAEVAEAYRARPEVLQAEANINAAERGVALARRSSLPSLAATWVYQYTPDSGGFSPKKTSWAAVAQVSVPLFDQGLSRARVQQARADVNTVRVARAQVLDGVALEVRQSLLALTEAQERLRVATAAVATAEEQYRLAQVRYRAGVTAVPGASPLLEISDAQTALTQAQTNLVNARYDVQDMRARLDRAAGRYAWNAPADSPAAARPSTLGELR